MIKDPVCKSAVNERVALATGLGAEYMDVLYLFCSSACKLEFHRQPNRYTRSRRLAALAHADSDWRSR